MDTNVLDWLEVTAAACPDKPAFLDEDGAVTFADVRREARIIGTAAARLRAGRKAPIAVMSGRNAHTPAVFLGAVYAGLLLRTDGRDDARAPAQLYFKYA